MKEKMKAESCAKQIILNSSWKVNCVIILCTILTLMFIYKKINPIQSDIDLLERQILRNNSSINILKKQIDTLTCDKN